MAKPVALRAKPRPRNLQQVLVDRAVRVVTVQAIFPDRRVFEQERSALFGMTLVAGVVDRGGPQQRFIRRAVRLMAVGADHLAFAQRHVRRAGHLRAPVLVALEAGLGLVNRLELEFLRHAPHDGVAIGAGHVADFVGAAAPVGAVAPFVAAKADGIVFLDAARQIFGPERHDSADAASTARLHVQRTRPVAVFARELARLILADPPHQGLRERFGVAGMAGHADLLADEGGFNPEPRPLSWRELLAGAGAAFGCGAAGAASPLRNSCNAS